MTSNEITYPVQVFRHKVFRTVGELDASAFDLTCEVTVASDNEKDQKIKEILEKAAGEISQVLRQ